MRFRHHVSCMLRSRVAAGRLPGLVGVAILARADRTTRGGVFQGGSGPRCLPETTTMTLAAERELAHMGETAGCSDHDHDLVHELSRRLDALWRYDQYIANAEWRDDLRQFWCDAKALERQAIQRLKELIAQEVRNGCF